LANKHIVCPHCHTANALPEERMADQPRCGKCHEAIFDAPPVELTTASFNRHIARNDIPVLVDFWAPWCGPCRTMAPAYEQAASLMEPEVRFAKLNTEDEQMIGANHGIRNIPTMVLFREGREVGRQSGAMMASAIVRWVRTQLDQ
jgi:thioredoxin 2